MKNQDLIILLETIYRLQGNPYSPYVGRSTLRCMSYVYHLMNHPVLTLRQFTSGLFKEIKAQIKDLLKTSNIITEEKLKGTRRYKVLTDFEDCRTPYQDLIKSNDTQIEKTVDLFSRIKDSEQAEEVATVLYTSKKLEESRSSVSEADIINYIVKWKKSWNKQDKIESLVTTIRNLTCLRWINSIYSPGLKSSEDYLNDL